MPPPQSSPSASLTPLDTALAALLRDLAPVAPIELPLDRCPRLHRRRHAAAESASAARYRRRRRLGVARQRSRRRVVLFAAAAHDIAGLGRSRRRMPEACDCVLDSDFVDRTGPLVQVLAEAIPGQGVRRAGGDIADGTAVVEAGRRVLPRDLLIARAAGLQALSVRRPRVRVVNVPSAGEAVTAQLIAESARKAGADVSSVEAAGRDAGSIASSARWRLRPSAHDRRQRCRPHRCDGDRRWPSAAR